MREFEKWLQEWARSQGRSRDFIRTGPVLEDSWSAGLLRHAEILEEEAAEIQPRLGHPDCSEDETEKGTLLKAARMAREMASVEGEHADWRCPVCGLRLRVDGLCPRGHKVGSGSCPNPTAKR